MPQSSTNKSKELLLLKNQISSLQKEVNELKAANKKLQANGTHKTESDESYRNIFNATDEAIFIHDLDTGMILDVNKTATKMFGFSKEEFLSASPDLMSAGGEYKNENAFKYLKLAAKNKPQSFKWHSKHKNGSLFWVIISLKLVKIGGAKRVLAVVKNIDSQVKAETALEESEELYKSLFELSPAAILLEDKNGKILDVNPAYTKATLFKREELIGKNIEILARSKKDKNKIKENISKILSKKELKHTVETTRKDGNPCFMHLNEKRIKLPDGEYGILVIAEDVTERLHAENALKDSETRYRQLFDHLPFGGEVLDKNGNILECSAITAKMLGYKKEELIGKNLSEIVDPEYHHVYKQKFPAILGGQPQDGEIKMIRKDGTTIDILRAGHPIYAKDNKTVTNVLAVNVDISERKKADWERETQINYLENIDKIEVAIRQSSDVTLMLNNVLTEMLEIFNSDRAWLLFPCSPKAEYYNVPMEVTRTGFPGALAQAVQIPNDPESSPIFKDALNSPIPLTFDKDSGQKIPMAQKKQFSIQSMIVSAIYPKTGEPWLLGMHQCSHDRIWTKKDQRLFKDIANRIADSLSSFLFLKDLHKSEELFRAVTEQTGEGIGLVDTEGNYQLVNPKFCEMTGYSKPELLKMNIRDLVPKETHIELFPKIKKGNEGTRTALLMRKNKAKFFAEVSGFPISLGEEKYFLGIVRDITERIKNEQALKNSEESYRGLINNSSEAIYILNKKAVFIDVNKAAEKMYGHPRKYLIGKSPVSVSAPGKNDLKKVAGLVKQAFKGESQIFEFWGIRKNKEIFPKEVRLDFAKYFGDNVVIAFAQDITERKKAEVEIKKNQEQLDLIYNSTSDSMALISVVNDNSFRLESFNNAYWQIAKMVNSELTHQQLESIDIGKLGRLLNWPDSLTEGLIINYQHAIKKRQPVTIIESIPSLNGNIYMESVYSPIFNQKVCTHILFSTRDITKRIEAEEALRASEEKYRQLVELAQEGIWLIDKDSNTSFVNMSMAKMLGYTPDEMIGRHLFSFMDKRGVEIANNNLKRREEGITEQHDFEFIKKDGNRIVTTLETAPILDDDGEYNGAIAGVIDITERKKSEEALRASEEKYRGIFESVPTSIFILDKEGIVIDINSFHINHISKNKATKNDFVGTNAIKRQSIINAGLSKEYAQLLKGKPIDLDDVYFPSTTGGPEMYANVKGVPLKDGDEIKGAVVITEDITRRKKVEQEHKKLEAQIQHAAKLESLGVLSGGIAHDFNNLLTGILGNVGLAELDLPPTSSVHTNLKLIERSSIRAADLCRQLLAYSGKGKFVVKALNLNEVIEEMGTLLGTSISKKAVLKYNFSKELPVVEVDTAQIGQVIMNLIINASDAIGEKSGVISITTGVMECDDSYLGSTFLNENLKAGIYVYVEVFDSGIGMDEETQAKIFDPFFTTKFTGRGLGLAAVLGIMRGHNGAIKIYSEPGKGTSFKILFPYSDKEAVTLPINQKTKQEWVAEGTILIIDDEDTIRDLGRQALEKIGFSILTAEDGLIGIKKFKKHKNEISAVLLDMTMPHLNGEETFRELRKINPKVRVVLSSGYNEQEATNNFVGKGLAGFLQKPYRAGDLIEKIKEIIEGIK